MTSFRVNNSGHEHFILWENDHIQRLTTSLNDLFQPIHLQEVEDKIAHALRFCLNYFIQQKCNFEHNAFSVLVSYIPSNQEVIFVMRKRELEIEKKILLVSFPNERWVKFPSELKIGFYSQELNLLTHLKKENPNFSVEVYFCSQIDGRPVIDEGSTNNIFIFDGIYFKTPPLRPGVLKGISRQKVLKYFKAKGIPFKVEEIELSEFKSAQSIWLCNAVKGFRKVSKLEEVDYTANNLQFENIWKELIAFELLDKS